MTEALMPAIDLRPQGDGAIRVGWPSPVRLEQVRTFARRAQQAGLPGLLELVPGYTTVTVFYQPETTGYADLCAALRQVAAGTETAAAEPVRRVEIPVLYGDGSGAAGDPGPDLRAVSAQAGLSLAETITLHSQAVYTVAMIGFQPGFPYLAGLPEALQMPRLAQPRLQVPAGSVAIGGSQSGVYPFAAPGGWRLIGQTPLRLFDARRAEPSLCRPGDEVRFKPVTQEQFHAAAR